MIQAPYRNAQAVLSDRVRWSIVVFSHLIRRARHEGWLDGAEPPEPLPDLAEVEAQIEGRYACSEKIVGTFPMQLLESRFELTPAQLMLLWLLVCAEASPAVARLVQAFGQDLSAQIAQELVPITTTELDALVAWGFVEMTHDPRVPAHRRWVRACDRVTSLARGELALDRELAELGRLVAPDEVTAVVDVPESVTCAFSGANAPLIVAEGAAGTGRTTLLLNAAAHAGAGVLVVRAELMAHEGEQLRRQLRAIGRECILLGVVPLFEDLRSEQRSALERELLPRCEVPVLVTSSEAQSWETPRPVVIHRVSAPSIDVRARVWVTALPGCASEVIADAASRYTTTPGTIIAAAAAAVARRGTGAIEIEDIHEGLRAHVDRQLAELARRVECKQTWQDLVLPSDQVEQIVELISRVRYRKQVLEDWGFADKVGRGLGLAALLSGPPGTGKTMVAGLIARELGLDLYQVDLSRIVSKYIGETEKNLARVFDAAESGHAILLFDEADSLFAKRSEVKSSNDRYANLEVNFLLQRIEQFSGISILTTNNERAIDEAFRRRLSIHVRFPTPEPEERAQLWRAMLPARAHVSDNIDFRSLASQHAMAGGYIKNAVLRAAYFAAEEGSAITMTHLSRAARFEYEAMGKLTSNLH